MAQDHAIYLFTLVVCALFGLAIGSFLNVVIYRLPRGESLAKPPSHCPNCNTELKPSDNIPILSWIILRGHCRYCQQPISVRYPVIELLTGSAYVGIAAAMGWSSALIPVLLVVSITIVALAVTFDHQPIPLSLVMVGFAACAALALVAVANSDNARIGWAALGALAISAAFAGIATVIKVELRRPLMVVLSVGWTVGWFLPLGIFMLAGWTLIAGAGIAIAADESPRKGPILMTAVASLAYALICVGAVRLGP
jgi:leader peptidase (prepilin peptidase) / N-methyltransferase